MKLFVDSACDVPSAYLEDHHVTILPLSVVVDEKEYLDMFEISNEQIYAAIEAGKHPSTSQVNLEKFDSAFRAAALEGQDALYIALSSELSGTYQAAVLAKSQVLEDYPDFDLRIIDSCQASLGIGLLVREAIEMMEAGFTIDEIEERITLLREQVVSIFTVQDLDYLAAGGRLSKSSAFLGGLLNIHPLLQVEEGKLSPKEKLRGRKKVLARMLERLQSEAIDVEKQTVLLVHTNDHETVNELADKIKNEIRAKDVIAYPIGAVVGAHTGLGTVGLFYFKQYE